MFVWIMAILVILLIGFMLWLIRRLRRKRALRILQRSSQQTTDEIVNLTYQGLLQTESQLFLIPQQLHSELVTDVWGRGVMVFEYQVPVVVNRLSLAELTQLLQKKLNEAAYEQRIASVSPRFEAMMVTDAWLLEGQYHFDVAFVVNQETIEYIEDMRLVTGDK